MEISIKDFYDHQKRYYQALLERSDKAVRGIVCIPTGGGKTRLAVTYAINCVLERGKKVLWLAQSMELLNQAYDTFADLIDNYEWMRDNAVRIHSNAARADTMNTGHRLVLVSFQSLYNHKSWREIIGDNTVVFIDEAHHIAAETYYNLLREFVEDKTAIGLTATPVRRTWEGREKLSDFFPEKNFNVNVTMYEMYMKHILVPPVFDTIDFYMDPNSEEEIGVRRLTSSEDYNLEILKRYKLNKDKYGKTVIFAIDKEHVNALYELFNSEYPGNVFKVYSGDPARKSNFDAFKRSTNGILINVNIMSEGVDIPDIKTVFLTRPLESQVAVTQMIGRALRVSKEHPEKNVAYVVNFAVSALRKKFLQDPKEVFRMYEVQWQGDKEEVERLDKEISALAKMVNEAKERNTSYSFSTICLAGHYSIHVGDTEDMLVPVSLTEYYKIEDARKGKKKFPSKLFFVKDASLFEQKMKEITDDNIEFVKYDPQLFEQFEKVSKIANEIYDNVIRIDPTPEQKREMIVQKVREITDDEANFAALLSYLSKIGTGREKDLVEMISNELVMIKYKRLEK